MPRRGRALALISSGVEGRLPSGLPYGSNTGRMYDRQPRYVRWRYPAPASVFDIGDSILADRTLIPSATRTPSIS